MQLYFTQDRGSVEKKRHPMRQLQLSGVINRSTIAISELNFSACCKTNTNFPATQNSPFVKDFVIVSTDGNTVALQP